MHCVVESIGSRSEAEYWVRNRRVLPHVPQTEDIRSRAVIDWSVIQPEDLRSIATLYRQNDMNSKAEDLYIQSLQGKEKTLGIGHVSTLSRVNSLSRLYKTQGQMVEVADMYMRALRGKEKTRGPEHTSTLKTVDILGNLYAEQSKDTRGGGDAYAGTARREDVGLEHQSKLEMIDNLENLRFE